VFWPLQSLFKGSKIHRDSNSQKESSLGNVNLHFHTLLGPCPWDLFALVANPRLGLRQHSHLSRCCHCQPNTNGFTSLIVRISRICSIKCNSSQGKELSQPTPHQSILPFNNWNIWLFTQTCQCVFTWLCQCHLELERDKRPSSFYLGHFSSSKVFDHITKDASIFHFKRSNSHRLNYFPTSTPSKHTSHHHNRPIASR